jgi:hypothetical protein
MVPQLGEEKAIALDLIDQDSVQISGVKHGTAAAAFRFGG